MDTKNLKVVTNYIPGQFSLADKGEDDAICDACYTAYLIDSEEGGCGVVGVGIRARDGELGSMSTYDLFQVSVSILETLSTADSVPTLVSLAASNYLSAVGSMVSSALMAPADSTPAMQ